MKYQNRNVCNILIRKPERHTPVWKQRRRPNDNIKLNFKETGCEGVVQGSNKASLS
jgi:hypothetical protein